MATKRQNILNTIQEIIRAVTIGTALVFNSESVKIGAQPPNNLETASYPQCFIYSSRETRITEEQAVIGMETWEWVVFLEIWGSDDVLEDILNAIHSAMYANYKFDDIAEYSERIGIDFQTIDPTQQIESMVIPYRIIYRNINGNMEL